MRRGISIAADVEICDGRHGIDDRSVSANDEPLSRQTACVMAPRRIGSVAEMRRGAKRARRAKRAKRETPVVKKLEDSQLETFDIEYMYEKRWRVVKAAIDRDFPRGDFSFVDIGGGNGMFADRLLQAYPLAHGTLLDNSELLLAKNVEHPRKKLVCESAENLGRLGEKFDVVFYNWVLHHLVGSTYRESLANVDQTLLVTRKALTDRARVSIFDNMYDGQIVDWLPSRLIFELTSSPVLRPLTARLGANTAGTGVCFQSRKQWAKTLSRAGFEIISYHDDDPITYSAFHRLFLHMGNVRAGHFWLAARTSTD